MNTNDPQAPYTVKLNGPIESATAPLIQKYYIGQFGDLVEITEAQFADWGMDEVVVMWADVQAKIASGELMVVKTVTMKNLGSVGDECTACGYFYEAYRDVAPQVGQHCKCGAKIIEAETK